MDVFCECCLLTGRGVCGELITRPEKSYWLWCVVVCDLETSWIRRPWPTGGFCAKKEKSDCELGPRILARAQHIRPCFFLRKMYWNKLVSLSDL